MKKMLVFQVGTEQYALDLAYVTGIKSVKHISDERQKSSNSPNLGKDDERSSLYDLISIFDKDTSGRDFENEKLIMVETKSQSLGMIVSRVDKVVSIEPDRIKPLYPIFKGSAMSCFPNILKHEDAIILILAPEGLIKVLQIKTGPGHKPWAENEEILGIVPEIIDAADIGYESHDDGDASLENLMQVGRDASPQAEPKQSC